MADGIELSVKQFKAGFFNVEAIKAKLDKTNRRVQSAQGAFIRRRMKSIVKYGKKSSKPGEPPKAHRSDGYTRKTVGKAGEVKSQAASPLRELIFFAYDTATDSTVIGPAKFGGGTAPKTLEKGGTAVIREAIERVTSGRKASVKQKTAYRRLLKEGRLVAPETQYKTRTVNIRPRPFAKPAGDEVSRSEKMKAILRGSVK